jgi:transmembrane sensor
MVSFAARAFCATALLSNEEASMIEPSRDGISVGEARWDAARGERVLERVKHGVLGRRRKRLALGAALGVLATAMIALGVVWLRAPDEPVATLVTRDSGSLRFSDGSRVDLTSGSSTVEVGLVSPSYTELVLESGSARFDVTPNPERRFAVRAGSTRIEVLGTRFTVEREAPRVRVAVEHGRVRVIWPGGESLLGTGEASWFPPASGQHAAAQLNADSRPGAEATSAAADPSAAAPAPDRAALRKTFLDFARGGEYQKAYKVLREAPQVVNNSAEDLMLAADAARLSGHPERAPEYLRRITVEHRRDPRAPLAAFTLGRILLTQLGQPAEAERAFGLARQLAPNGALAEDALARQVEAAHRAGQAGRAESLATEYTKRYPGSKRLDAVRRFGGLSP